MVQRVVDNQGKSNVTGGFVVETTDNKSDEGSSLSPSMAGDPVYVVWVEGHLQCLGCSSPPKSPIVAGGAQEFVILRATMKSVEFGTVPTIPDLPATGPTYRLHLSGYKRARPSNVRSRRDRSAVQAAKSNTASRLQRKVPPANCTSPIHSDF